LGMADVSDPDLLGAPTSPGMQSRVVANEAPAHSGVLPDQYLKEYVRSGVILGFTPIGGEQIQPASLDLRLGNVAYRVRASFLPGANSKVMDRVRQMDGYRLELANSAVLETGQVYIIQLQEELALPPAIQGFANPKSSTGRLDILTRLVTDYGTVFDQTIKGYRGPLFAEVAPQTFSVVVRPGTSLNQIRFQRGSGITISNGLLRRHYQAGDLVRPYDKNEKLDSNLVPVTIDLIGDRSTNLIGYRAKRHTDRIDLSKVRHYDWEDYWEPIFHRKEPNLTLNPGDFYILATREEVRVPPEYAAEMVAYHTRSGEYRVHYAGFFDPGFGWDTSAGGSRAVLEVRSHEVPFMLEHGQTVGWLRYDRMAAVPEHVYGVGIGSSYQSQGLALGKQFKPYPPTDK